MISFGERTPVRCFVAGIVTALAVVLIAPNTHAQNIRRAEEPAPATYVLHATATWGAAQDQAVAAAGGVLMYHHVETGIGVATSTSESFLEAALQSGAFEGVGHDVLMRWGSSPAAEEAPEDPAAARGTGGMEATAANPNDETLFNSQWALTAIHAPEAWALGYDGTGVRVAVIDGGICATHVDLDANLDLAAARSFVPGRHFADDATGFRRACYLSGIIAAEDNNAGVIGVAPHATIIPCKVLHNGVGTFDALIEAILYASDPISAGGAGANIILIGFGSLVDIHDQSNRDLYKALTKAITHARHQGTLVVAGVGDEATDIGVPADIVEIPAQCIGTMSVSATGPVGFGVNWPNGATNFTRPAVYTNYGNLAEWIAGPGGDSQLDPGLGNCSVARIPSGVTKLPCFTFDLVVSTGYVSGSNSIYTWSSGTGAAAAHVAGVAALMMQKYPGINPIALMNHLAHSATDETPGFDLYRGSGLVNAYEALSGPPHFESDDDDGLTPPSAGKASQPRAATGLDLAVSPNPVREGATFAITLPGAGTARLELFDLAGRSITTLFDGPASAGRTTLKWDGHARSGSTAAPGAYFARLTTPGASLRRIVIVSP